jgi:hypothetical protein
VAGVQCGRPRGARSRRSKAPIAAPAVLNRRGREVRRHLGPALARSAEPRAVEVGGTLAAVTPSPVPGKRNVVVEYLLVNTEGKILAVLQSPAEVARQLARIEGESEANESVRVVRHDEHRGDLVASESFVTAMPLPSLLERPRRR